MKHFNAILLLLLPFLPVSLSAQDKIGYLNAQELLVIMPEYKVAEDSLKAYARQIQEEYMSLQSEYQAMGSSYESLIDGPVQSQEIEKDIVDIQNLENRMLCLEQSSEQILINKQDELLKPLIALLNKSIRMVAQEHGYTYVIDSNVFDVLSILPEADDIMPLVVQKLGGSWVNERGLD